ncbi:hypothetical protein Tco_0206580 [Tanacetum coccineum]
MSPLSSGVTHTHPAPPMAGAGGFFKLAAVPSAGAVLSTRVKRTEFPTVEGAPIAANHYGAAAEALCVGDAV